MKIYLESFNKHKTRIETDDGEDFFEILKHYGVYVESVEIGDDHQVTLVCHLFEATIEIPDELLGISINKEYKKQKKKAKIVKKRNIILLRKEE